VNNAGPDANAVARASINSRRRSPAGLDHLLGVPHHGRHGPHHGWRWALGRGAWALKRLDHATLVSSRARACRAIGFVAVLTGWITAEVGRQPYVVYGVLRTADAVSPVPAAPVATSLLFFMVVYAIVFSAGALYILRLMANGPDTDERAEGHQGAARHAARRWASKARPPRRHAHVMPGSNRMFGELSMIWAVLIAVAVFLYVALDGFDLGVGILFPFAKDAPRARPDAGRHRAGVGRQRDMARARRRRPVRGVPESLRRAHAGAVHADHPDAAGADLSRRRVRVSPSRP
jgi:hypothetical protein